MTYDPLGRNIPVLTGPFDSSETNSVEPSAGQLAGGFLPNVDNVDAETQNFMHGASIASLYLAQSLGLFQTFNPDASGASKVACPEGGIVALRDGTSKATQFYVCQQSGGMPIGFTDPSADPSHWALIDFRAIATYTTPYADATGTSDAITVSYPSVIYPVLSDGFTIRVGIATSNTTTSPTLSASFNGQTPTPYTIKKKGSSGLIPLAVGDLFGTCQFEFDQPNSVWILDNPPGHEVQPGSLVFYAGSTPPPGVLQLPSAATNINRASYPALTAVLVASGSPWGAGDGSTTIGMPYIPPGYSILHYVGFGSLGALTNGKVKNHTHQYTYAAYPGTQYYGVGGGVVPTAATTSNPNSPEGGVDNLPAGVLFNVGVKY